MVFTFILIFNIYIYLYSHYGIFFLRDRSFPTDISLNHTKPIFLRTASRALQLPALKLSEAPARQSPALRQQLVVGDLLSG